MRSLPAARRDANRLDDATDRSVPKPISGSTSETRSGEKQPSTLVFRRGDALPILSLGTEAMTTTASAFQFSPNGRSAAWANSDGTVDVADLDQLEQAVKAIEIRRSKGYGKLRADQKNRCRFILIPGKAPIVHRKHDPTSLLPATFSKLHLVAPESKPPTKRYERC